MTSIMPTITKLRRRKQNKGRKTWKKGNKHTPTLNES